ncbi:hypothetical protein Daus18300_011981 [Diaporthe australafricana]|uniref:Clr5 domain-containing protein n=1 Tax=Diaporthe australafricana TaxID=127596 RepID=A0ABR3W4I1_9PEZI
MLRDHSFNASDKLYKSKFSEWGWQKNLSTDTALFMVQKGKQRRRNLGKDTIFHFGGREWPLQKAETTVSRSKRRRDDDQVIIVETPQGMTYETPAALVLSPENTHVYNERNEEDHSDAVSDANSAASDDEDMLRLTWEGHTGPEFLNLWKTALKCRDEGKANEAEDHLERAWTGLRHISGATHEDTNKVAYSLASLYADTGRMDKAVALVEHVIQDHVKTHGYESKITQQRVLLAAEILEGWNRHAEALGMLSRSKELLAMSRSDQTNRPRKARNGRRAKGKGRSTTSATEEVSLLLADGFDDSDPERIDWGLTVARRQVLARSESAEMLLQAIITHCEIHTHENLRQHLVARGELLALYEKLGVADDHVAAFEGAMNALKLTWEHVDWDEDRFEHFEIMEASLQLIANMLKSGYRNEARRFFLEAAELAAEAFGSSDERTIWILITIGIVYQTHLKWSDARDWFEQAFAAALAEYGNDPKEGIVKSLQIALDREHFSYVSDEGRPYKTVFGVSGIHIMPGRLHLE